MILAGGHAGAADLARFRTEAEAIARIKHANIIQIYEIGDHEGKPYFSLEFCAGGSLAQKIDGTPMQPKEAARMVENLARGMEAAHREEVIHRDLKPANVLLAKDGTPKITDFGLAKKLDDAGQTQSGAIMGTPSYMAPEQAEGKTATIGPSSQNEQAPKYHATCSHLQPSCFRWPPTTEANSHMQYQPRGIFPGPAVSFVLLLQALTPSQFQNQVVPSPRLARIR